jgi:NAD(P) transhydrogenase subunit beta
MDNFWTPNTFALLYLISGVFFILGLKGLASPATARRGNMFAMVGMVIAILVTFQQPDIKTLKLTLLGMVIGAAIGIPIALKIKMTAMPQLVALFHSFVGMAAVLIAAGMFLSSGGVGLSSLTMFEIFMGAWIGAITFSGSIVAFGKLQGIFRSAPVTFKGQHLVNLILFLAMFGVGIHFAMTGCIGAFAAMCVLAFILGVTIIIPIGGADMPVVVSMLNSYSGWAAVATGFTLNNYVLIITGALIGASGAILSYIMCKAMNRSFISVILGGFGADESADEERQAAADKGIKEAAAEDVAFMMDNAESVIIVPGYGMAVAQAQHALREVLDVLEEKEIKVTFAIHPVAGRMPGHMNVLLAEADVAYDRVEELEEVNNKFAQADVVLVVGANDVVNPDAKDDKNSPLYGMPVLEVWKAKAVYVVKRSMNVGYAGVENSLFFRDNSYMVFGDAKEVAETLSNALKE